MSKYSREPNGSLFIRNLPLDSNPRELREMFEKHGSVKDVYIPQDYYTKRQRGFGYIQFHDPKDAEDALDALHGSKYLGQCLDLEFAKGDRKTPGEMRTRGRPNRNDRRDDSYSRYGRRGGRDFRRRRGRSRSRSRSNRDRSRSRSVPHGRRNRSRSNSYKRRVSRSRSRSVSPREYRRGRSRSFNSHRSGSKPMNESKQNNDPRTFKQNDRSPAGRSRSRSRNPINMSVPSRSRSRSVSRPADSRKGSRSNSRSSLKIYDN